MKFAVLAAAFSAIMAAGSAQAVSPSALDAVPGVLKSSVVQVRDYDDDDYARRRRRREREREREKDKEGVRCGEAISVTGDARPIERLAHNKAVKAWQEQVRFRYGEEYMNFGRAEIIKDQCEASGFSGIGKRCRIVAKPCKEVF